MSPKSRSAESHKTAERLTIANLPIDLLKPDPRNPRQHSKKQIHQIAKSIAAFGFNVPVLVDADNHVIAGHGRLLACRELGWETVPTTVLEHLTPTQIQAYRIADNRLTDNSSWDETLLAETLRDLTLIDLDFSIEDTGFDMGEIDMRIVGLEAASASDADPADAQPASIAGPPVTQLGDLWVLGCHRVLCGSALVQEDYHTLMGAKLASLVFTDPPYNVKIDGHVSGLGKVRHREFVMASGEMTTEEFTSFLKTSFSLMAAHSRAGSLHYVCMDWGHIDEITAAGRQAYQQLKNLCVWVKSNAGMGSLYRSQHELVFVFKHGDKPHTNNVQLGRHGRNRTNVWTYPGMNSFTRKGEEGNLLFLHPTVKPVALVADAILDSSARGDVILDPFLGSGTTLIAAERTGRRCHGLELDPLYVDGIIRRWQAFTGDAARHVQSGLPFDAMAEKSRTALSIDSASGHKLANGEVAHVE